MTDESSGVALRPSGSGRCDCHLEQRTEGIEPATARERDFVEVEVIHHPEYRSIIYRCVRCGRRFEGWYEGGGFHFAPIPEPEATSPTDHT